MRGAVGPYLNVFLVTQQHWSQSEVGLVTTIGGLLGLAVQTPIGAAIDETHAKRGIVVLALAVLAVTAAVIFAWPTFWPVAIFNSLVQAAKAKARGYRSTRNLKAMVYLLAGKLDLRLPA